MTLISGADYFLGLRRGLGEHDSKTRAKTEAG
jgi:hypothetical protein